MIFTPTPLEDSFVIEPEKIEDERGFFYRGFCEKEFAHHGLKTDIMQANVSYNRQKGTLRGMHFQRQPFAEAKLVRCTAGAIYDVIIDLRQESETFGKWFSAELTAENQRAIYVPEGFAHGFQTLVDHSEVAYQMFEFYSPEHADGVRWDDPAFHIVWPLAVSAISTRDRSYSDFERASL